MTTHYNGIYYLECDCPTYDHSVKFMHWNDEPGEYAIVMGVFPLLNPRRGWLERLKLAWVYLWNPYAAGHYDEIVINRSQLREFRSFIDKCDDAVVESTEESTDA